MQKHRGACSGWAQDKPTSESNQVRTKDKNRFFDNILWIKKQSSSNIDQALHFIAGSPKNRYKLSIHAA